MNGAHVPDFPLSLELRHYRLLVAVGAAGSLAAAARTLHLSASALSHQLRDAEERLGVALFQRRHRKLLLTRAGEQLVLASRRVLAEAALAETAVRGVPHDVLRVSTECFTCYGWVPQVLGEFEKRHPRVELRVVLEATRQPLPALLAGDLDLAIMSTPPGQGRLRAFPLFADELVLLTPAEHPLAGRRFVRAEDLAGEHLLVYDAPRDDLTVFTRVLTPAQVEPRRVSRVALTEAMIELVRGGVGLAVLPSSAAPATKDLSVVRITAGGLRRRWQAVAMRARAGWAPLRDLIELIRLVGAPAGVR